MSETPSTMLPLGTIAPDFTLLDTVSGKNKSLKELKSNVATIIMFICNHCPYVLHIKDELVNIANEHQQQGMQFIAISSNDVVSYPADAPDKMTIFAQENNFNFPYLYDESQAVAKAYQAACTPDFFIFDNKLACVYRGQFDKSRPGSAVPVNGEDMRAALDAILENKTVAPEQIPSVGCNIKWK